MIVYLDTSTLAKLYAEEDGSAEVALLVQNASALASSSLAYPEIRAALARRRRERSMTARQVDQARQQFESDWSSMLVIRSDEALTRRAGELADTHALRGADAVHLASFERLLTSVDHDDVEFSCADERLTRAARKLG